MPARTTFRDRVTFRQDSARLGTCRCLALTGRWLRLKLRVRLLAIAWKKRGVRASSKHAPYPYLRPIFPDIYLRYGILESIMTWNIKALHSAECL